MATGGANNLPPSGGGAGAGGGPNQKARIRTKRPMSAAMGGPVGGIGGPANVGGVVGKQAAVALDQELDELEQSVNVQVRQRDPSPPDGSSRRSKLGQLKEQTSGAIREGLEGIKRPLSSLLRRPGSRSGSRDRSGSIARDPSDGEIAGGRGGNNEGGGESEGGGFRPARKTGNWGDEGALAGPARGGGRPGTSFGGRPGSSRGRGGGDAGADGQVMVDKFDGTFGQDGGGTTPDIPRLEELQASEFGMAVAQAPSVAVNRVATYKELDGDLMRQAAFATLEEIDLSLLTKCLCPDEEVREEAVPWTWDYLFTSICSDLRSDWEEGEGEDEDMMMVLQDGGEDIPTQRMSATGRS